ncbi:MAG: M6 family metalloprotease domain-containing protein, partial [Desulfuromonadales bacterium]
MWRRILGIVMGMFMLASVCHGAPASPDLVEIQQPDGSVFKGKIHGDEFQNWVEAPETGHTVIRNKQNDYWEYAEKRPDGTLAPSGMKVVPGKLGAPEFIPKGLKPERDIEKVQRHNEMLQQMYQQRLAPSATSPDGSALLPTGGEPLFAVGDWTPVPVSGPKKVLVVLINFSNRSLVTTANGWNSVIFDTAPGALSVANFYNDNSFGAMTISPATHTQPGNPQGIVTVTIANTHPNLGSSSNYATESAVLNAALAQAASYVNFASFDTNANGTIEQSELSIYFIYAGWEASGSGKTPNIWAHAWGGSGVTVGGKAVTKWALNGELNNSDAQHPMGVIAHELGHALCGLPDLYDTSSTNAGLGAFSLMSSGSWGGDTGQAGGTTPTALDAWSREYLGWTTPVVPSNAGSYNLGTALSSNTAALKLINSAQSTSEYFLAENRYPTGWDKGLRRFLGAGWSGGLLITHVDITSGTQGANDINRYVAGGHQGVMAEQANTTSCNMATSSCAGSSYTLFYSGNNASFADTSAPNSRYYSGVQSGVNLTSISAPGATMSLTYGVTPTPAASVSLTPNLSSPQSVGQSITFTAAGSGGTGSYDYQFWLLPPGGSYSIKQAYSSSATWTWNTSGLAAGTYTIQVWARSAGTSPAAGYDTYKATTFTVSSLPAASGVTLTPSVSSPQNAGTSVTFTAAGAGGTGSYDYQFWLLPPGGSYSIKQAYSSSATW